MGWRQANHTHLAKGNHTTDNWSVTGCMFVLLWGKHIYWVNVLHKWKTLACRDFQNVGNVLFSFGGGGSCCYWARFFFLTVMELVHTIWALSLYAVFSVFWDSDWESVWERQVTFSSMAKTDSSDGNIVEVQKHPFSIEDCTMPSANGSSGSSL